MAPRTDRVEVSTYLTPDQARDLDEYCRKEGGISRSAALRSLGIKQLRYVKWQERLRIRGRLGREPSKERQYRPREPPGKSSPHPDEVGRRVEDVPHSEILEAALAMVRKEPHEIDRILAARTMRALGVRMADFNPKWNFAVQEVVKEARQELNEPGIPDDPHLWGAEGP